MSLDKGIAHGKEHRKSYRERGLPGETDRTCRPHGGGSSIPCPWCERNRQFSFTKLMAEAADEMSDFQLSQQPPDQS